MNITEFKQSQLTKFKDIFNVKLDKYGHLYLRRAFEEYEIEEYINGVIHEAIILVTEQL